MTMTLDHQNNRHLGGPPFDHLSYGSGPHFSNPWSSESSHPHLSYQPMSSNNMGFDALAKQAQRPSTSSLPYSSVPASAPLATSGYSAAPPYGSSDLVNFSQDLLNHANTGYSTAPASVGTYAPTSVPYPTTYSSVAPPHSQDSRRLSATSQPSYSDALDASRGMVALSGQDLTTPRGLYDTRSDRNSHDGYGFPTTHSSHSSISAASSSYAGSYASYAESVGSSVSDYGSQSDLESVNSRTLPRPSGLMANNGLPPPQSMMGQFNSKVSSSTQKKHKCKICDKRFTRPSSLQTHMYSHTGEKPYACEAEGCGRHFSVVSNLRRHRKVHKGDRLGGSDHGSPEGSWASDK